MHVAGGLGMMNYRVLIVEDETALSQLVRFHLQNEGYTAFASETAAGAMHIVNDPQKIPHLMIVDVMLPGMDGFELVRNIRRNIQTRSLPIIMLTARGTEEDRVAGFESGADDYVTKPFSPRELMLRVRRLLDFAPTYPVNIEDAEPVEFGCLSVDASRFKMKVEGRSVDVSATELKILIELIQVRGKVLSRRRLLKLVWGEMPNVTDRTIDTHIKRLRKKMGPAAQYIETVRSVGYRWAEQPE